VARHKLDLVITQITDQYSAACYQTTYINVFFTTAEVKKAT